MKRRQLIGVGVGGSSSLLLGGCALNGLSEAVGNATQPLNERIEALLQGTGPVPEFRRDQVDPAALLINSFNGVPRLDPQRYRLRVDGLVGQPLSLDLAALAALAALPQHQCVIRHVCVEGWAAIVAWSGVRLATGMNGAPLPVANGAPLRLATPIKLGYKQSKWVTGIRVAASLGERRGTWEDQGYEWFAGL